jgi:hypothetical protein
MFAVLKRPPAPARASEKCFSLLVTPGARGRGGEGGGR